MEKIFSRCLTLRVFPLLSLLRLIVMRRDDVMTIRLMEILKQHPTTENEKKQWKNITNHQVTVVVKKLPLVWCCHCYHGHYNDNKTSIFQEQNNRRDNNN